jgi:subtilase family serine protease
MLLPKVARTAVAAAVLALSLAAFANARSAAAECGSACPSDLPVVTLARPDLVVTSIAADRQGDGPNVTVKVTVTNRGPVATNAGFTVTYTVDGANENSGWTLSPLGAGQQRTFTFLSVIPHGNLHFFAAVADGDDAIVESNEGNNSFGQNVVIS